MTDDKKRKLHRRSTTTGESIIEKKPQDKPQQKDRVNIGVSINGELWRGLRALAIIQGRLTGELLDEAIENYLKIQKNGEKS